MFFNSEEEKIKAVLNRVGYGFMEPTEESIRECFYDFVCCGVWENVHYNDDDLGQYSVKSICRNLWDL